jgi:hypothetical protein
MHSSHIILLLFILSTQIPRFICLGTWTWMFGENTLNSYGIYGEIGVPNSNNIPRSRFLATSSYDKSTDTLWLFGGYANSGKN